VTTYYTYQWQVPLGPRQSLGFTPNLGYYARTNTTTTTTTTTTTPPSGGPPGSSGPPDSGPGGDGAQNGGPGGPPVGRTKAQPKPAPKPTAHPQSQASSAAEEMRLLDELKKTPTVRPAADQPKPAAHKPPAATDAIGRSTTTANRARKNTTSYPMADRSARGGPTAGTHGTPRTQQRDVLSLMGPSNAHAPNLSMGSASAGGLGLHGAAERGTSVPIMQHTIKLGHGPKNPSQLGKPETVRLTLAQLKADSHIVNTTIDQYLKQVETLIPGTKGSIYTKSNLVNLAIKEGTQALAKRSQEFSKVDQFVHSSTAAFIQQFLSATTTQQRDQLIADTVKGKILDEIKSAPKTLAMHVLDSAGLDGSELVGDASNLYAFVGEMLKIATLLAIQKAASETLKEYRNQTYHPTPTRVASELVDRGALYLLKIYEPTTRQVQTSRVYFPSARAGRTQVSVATQSNIASGRIAIVQANEQRLVALNSATVVTTSLGVSVHAYVSWKIRGVSDEGPGFSYEDPSSA
jgi:hypothetical protein